MSEISSTGAARSPDAADRATPHLVRAPYPRRAVPTVIVIGDRMEAGDAPADLPCGPVADNDAGGIMPDARDRLVVEGGYLERLPLALVKAGIVDRAEIWHHRTGRGDARIATASPLLVRRTFRASGPAAPIASDAMLAHLAEHGAPDILIVFGLGVDAAILDACAGSVLIYNSIDAPALRIPDALAQRFDLILTGAQWQSDVVAARAPGVATLILPVGPEFAAIDQFRPLGTDKPYDLIYVAAAQPYKRHDILFDALAQLPRSVRALCVFGYGEMAEMLRDRAAADGLSVDFIGPPGVPFDAVNRLMNSARIGVVCGIDDGAPAILTEYMLAGLPVLANEALSCGLQFVLPETGAVASADGFAQGIVDLLARADTLHPRDAVLARWTWPHSVRRIAGAVAAARAKKRRAD
ncbi:glycosyltransferase [Sphingomonas montana]|uniref:glycosyltransferase n=1 Tax=Sphingomonas montana TaxID=1843236 RepID=UPI001F0A86ED|nr:glycosyltransferase [Sphingomonas montana]